MPVVKPIAAHGTENQRSEASARVFAQVLEQSGEACYEAKRKGRGRLQVAALLRGKLPTKRV